MKMKIIIIYLILGALLNSTNVLASTITVDCDNFNGPALYYKDGKMEVQNDGYKGTWTFIIDSDRPDEVTYVNRGPYVGVLSRKAKVLLHNKAQITIIDQYPKAIWLYSLYPEHQIAYMTVHKAGTLGEAAAVNTSFSKCSFSDGL